MASLACSYLGIPLRTPIILSSSGLTESAEKIKKAADAGIGAVVVKSLFEEMINYEVGAAVESSDYSEAGDYMLQYTKEHTLTEFLNTIEKSKNSVDIPIIASINAVNQKEWVTFAKRFESAGADALELNINIIPVTKTLTGADIEQKYFNIVSAVKAAVKIPIAVKISYHFSNILNIVHHLEGIKADGIVMFNRFYEPDIDIDNLDFKSFPVFSNSDDLRHALRWTGILSSVKNHIDISVSTGVHKSSDVIKSILAGADTVQICSTAYQKGLGIINELNSGIEQWMQEKSFDTIDEFKGLMSYNTIKDPAMYERSQFMKYFTNHG